MKKTTKYALVTIIIIIAIIPILANVAFFAYTFWAPSCMWSQDLVDAIMNQDTDLALALIDEGKSKGYDMDAPTFNATVITSMCEMSPDIPLTVACQEKNLTVVERLLDEGASVNPEDKHSWNYIYCVMMRGYSPRELAIISLLIERGADVEFRNESLNERLVIKAVDRPLHGTYRDEEMDEDEVAAGIVEIFRYLAEYTDCYVTDGAGRNALHCAVLWHNWHLAEVLVTEYNFDISAKNLRGETAYDIALQEEAPENILALLNPSTNWIAEKAELLKP